MPLPTPQLDDRSFSELVATLREQIPGYSRAWTDFNPSDMGITLLELWCWLAEMILYRMNQIPARSTTNFFKLILDPPEPVIAEVSLTLRPQFSDRPPSDPRVIPAGTRFATELLAPPEVPPEAESLLENGQLIFETYRPVEIPVAILSSPPDVSLAALGSPPDRIEISLPVRSRVVISNEELGMGTGQPDQIFYLDRGPVLLDPNHTDSGPIVSLSSPPDRYNPNPQIQVGQEVWEYVPDLLDARPDARQFTVEQLSGGVRFGNGTLGQIPPAGARIVAQHYQIILGKEVKIGQDMLKEIVDPIPDLPFSDILNIANTPAEGGANIYTREEASSKGLASLRETFRAITAADFEEIASTQYNRAQESSWVPEEPSKRVARAVAVPGKNLEATPPFEEQPATVSVIILPWPQNPQEVQLQPSQELKANVARFLEQRRLITTRVHVVGPQYAPVSLNISVAAEPRTVTQQVRDTIAARLQQFFHPLTGGEQGNGWPIGRNVYQSELFQLLEAVAGVDHVNTIVLNGDPDRQAIRLAENELPSMAALTIAL
jgi:hypothetical protein